MITPMIAWMILASKRSDGFLSQVAGISIFGVALGVMALIVVTSVINGFEGELGRVISGMNGDLLVYTRGEPLENGEEFASKLKKAAPEIQATTLSFVTELMIAGPSSVAGGILEGVDPPTVSAVTDVDKKLVEGRMPISPGEVAIPRVLADRIGVNLDGEVKLILPFAGVRAETADASEPITDVAPRMEKAKVVGIFQIGFYDYDSKYVIATLEGVRGFVQYPGRVTTIRARLNAGASPRKIADRLSEQFGYPLRVKDWTQLNRNLFYAIELEKVVIAIILTTIVLVAAFNVVGTLMMMIHDKSKEIAILKAMGYRSGQAFRLFALAGLGIGSVGSIAGVGLGLLGCWLVTRLTFFKLPAEIYFISYLPVVIRPREVAALALLALLISLLATLYPAYKVARAAPSEGLRHE